MSRARKGCALSAVLGDPLLATITHRASPRRSAQISIAPPVILPNLARQFSEGKMADAANKYPENVEGGFYVDDQCIDCDLCRETAPANFKRNDDGGHSYVYKQPEAPDEEGLCKEAMEGCPVEAIGNDGDGA